MATNLAVNDILEWTIYCQAETQFSANVFHYKVTALGVGNVTDAQVLTLLDNAYAAVYTPCLSEKANYWGVRLQIIKPVARSAQVSILNRAVGEVVGDLMSTMTCGVIKKQTSVASKRARGRCYIPFPSETSNDATGSPTGAYKTVLQALADIIDDVQNLAPGGNTITLTPVVFSRTAQEVTTLNQTIIRTEWGTQRRRSQINKPDADPLAV